MSRQWMVNGLLLLATALAAGCDGDGAVGLAQQAPLPGPETAAVVALREGSDEAMIDQVVQMYNTGMNEGGWALAEEIYAPGATFHLPGFPQVTDLPSLIAELSFESLVLNDDFHITMDDVFGAGDDMVARLTATADWIYGVADPVPYVHPLIVVFRFENGKIAEEWWQFDMLGVQEQVGFLPSTRTGYGWSPPSAVTGDPGIPQQNASLARRAIQLVQTGNLVLGDHVLSPAYLNHDPALPMATDRSSFYSVALEAMRAAFPDVRLTIDDLVASGDRVAVRFTARGTHLGTFAGIPATGREAEWTHTVIYRMADRQIVEGWSAWDAAGLLQQLMAP